MTSEKLTNVFRLYDAHLEQLGHQAFHSHSPDDWGCHLRNMCKVAAGELVPAGRVEKAMRWLGFVQGVLVAKGLFTVEELKNHSKPDGE